MRALALTGGAAAVTALAVVLSGCGADTKTGASGSMSSASSAMSSEKTSPSPSAATTKPKVADRDEDAAGPNDTIATYIQENGIAEMAVQMGDPGAPTIDLPVPDGWEPAGEDTPEWAYGAIIYTGPEAADYPPSIVAIVSKLTGDVDPQAIIDLAPGELNNLEGFEAMNKGAESTLSEFPAYQLAGTWQSDGETRVVAQKTVVIPTVDGLYVLQLNADGLESQLDILGAATDIIDSETTITP